MKNVICIDLTKFNNEAIIELCNTHDLCKEEVLRNKKIGVAKLFINTDTNQLIAYITKKDKTLKYTDVLADYLNSIKSVEIVQINPIIDEVISNDLGDLTIDSILDKISKYGITSISANEKAFLDANS